MAKKAPTNYGQTGVIEEIGFFRGEKKKAKKTKKRASIMDGIIVEGEDFIGGGSKVGEKQEE